MRFLILLSMLYYPSIAHADWTDLRMICQTSSVTKFDENAGYYELKIDNPNTLYVLEPKTATATIAGNSEPTTFTHEFVEVGEEAVRLCRIGKYIDIDAFFCHYKGSDDGVSRTADIEIARLRTDWIYSRNGTVSAASQAYWWSNQIPAKAKIFGYKFAEVGGCQTY